MAATDATKSINPIVAMLAGLVVAGCVHTAKTSFRPLVTATTGGLGNPVVSGVEDGTAIGLTVIALIAPVVIGFVLALLLVALVLYARRRRSRRVAPTGH